MKKRLAIIIPAFKSRFLSQAIESIANQTCKDFTLYIGDDASCDNIKEIVDRFSNRIDIVYHKFENNLGSSNLVGQWHRSINLSHDEVYIWLFSDDDIMPEQAVELFFRTIEQHRDFDLFRFNIDLIDENGKITNPGSTHPEIESSEDFIKRRLKGETLSSVCEYIFSRKAFNSIHGFVNFPLAWGSDDATWYLISKKSGIYTIPGYLVHWRLSGINISSVTTNNKTKFKASLQYLKWLKDQAISESIRVLIPKGLLQQAVYLKIRAGFLLRNILKIVSIVGFSNCVYLVYIFFKGNIKLFLRNSLN